MSRFQVTPTMWEFIQDPNFVRVIGGPIGCLAGETLVVTEQGPRRIDVLDRPTRVLSWDETLGRFRFALASASFPKQRGDLVRISTQSGYIDAAANHRVLLASGEYVPACDLHGGDALAAAPQDLLESACLYNQPNAGRCARPESLLPGFLGSYATSFRRRGGQLLCAAVDALTSVLRPICAPVYTHLRALLGDPLPGRMRTPAFGFADRLSSYRWLHPVLGRDEQGASANPFLLQFAKQCFGGSRTAQQFLPVIDAHRLGRKFGSEVRDLVETCRPPGDVRTILAVDIIEGNYLHWDLQVPNTNNYVTVDGAIHHNSGKSVLCVHELISMAIRQAPNERGERKTSTLIVRNTFDQLRSTTMKTFLDWFPHGEWGLYKASEKTFYMDHSLPDGTRVKAEFAFMPLDTPDDVRKALSLELTFLWANEWREIHPEVVDGLLMRLRRFPSMKDGGPSRSCAIFDTNMPDLDTWHFDKMENPPHNWAVFLQPPAIINLEESLAQGGGEPDALEAVPDAQGTSWWVNPRADNLGNLDPAYYPGIIPGKSEDFINVYLRCRYGRSLSGVPVFDKTFNPEFHIAEKPFTPLKSPDYPLIIGLDFGRTPATALLQRNAWGQLVALDELTSENMGIETFLGTKLGPLLDREEYLGCHVVVAPDPAGWAKQQIGEISPVDVVKRMGYKVVRPVTNDPERRIEAVERVLLRHVGGKPALIVNPQCREIIKAFRYGYRYKVNRSGMQDNKPDKNSSSHCMDGLQYGVMVAESGAAGAARNQARSVVPAAVSSRAWT